MRRRIAHSLIIAALLANIASSRAAELPRIASMNVCTDQLLLTLANPAQILGLSPYARDTFQSWAADDARRYRLLSGGAEDILILRPDIVVASTFDKRATRELLKEKGLHLAEFDVPRSLDDVKEQIRRMGEITQHPDRAAAQIERLDAAIARARQVVAQKNYRVLPLSRRGWVSGSESLLGSLLTEVGLFNIAGDLGVAFGGFASLEEIVSLKPDFLLVSEGGDLAEDDGRAFLLHPALERSYPPSKRIVVPDRLTVCGGLMLADALNVLIAELARVGR
jgi:iron complex transport system substrate-binding protein